MTAEELLQTQYNPNLWEFARDNSYEIMEKFTQTFPTPKFTLPDNNSDDDWTNQHINKKTLLHKHYRHQNSNESEWPFNGHELPNHDDSKGWLKFLDSQKKIYNLKQGYLESGDTAYLVNAFIVSRGCGFYPPLWVLDHWLWPAFCAYTHFEGKKNLETCLGLKGNQRTGNMFHQEKRDRQRFYILLQIFRLKSATGLSIQKCSEILSMRQGLPTPSTMATMYKKNSKDFPEELLDWEIRYKELCDKSEKESTQKNPFLPVVDPREVFNDHGKHFFDAANSNRPDITVTMDDYNKFAKKIEKMTLS